MIPKQYHPCVDFYSASMNRRQQGLSRDISLPYLVGTRLILLWFRLSGKSVVIFAN